MLNSADAHVSFGHNRSALGIHHVFSHGIYYRFTFQVNALNLVSGIFWGGIEGHSNAQSCVQTLSKEGKTAF